MIIRDSGMGQLEEFSVDLNAEGSDTYVAAEGQRVNFKMPFTREEVEAALGDFSPNRLSTDPLVSFGSTLFSSLFSGKLGRRLWQKMDEVEKSNRALRLRIVSNVERTQHLPWELLFDPSRGDFMSLSGRIALVRTRPENMRDTLSPLTSLRILAVSADPLGTMRTGDDLAILRRLTSADTRVQLTVIENATPETLAAALKAQTFDIFHFAGTGEVLDRVSKRGGMRQALRLAGDSSSGVLLARNDLGRMLAGANVRLAVLNGCHTDWVLRSLAKYIPLGIGLRSNVTVESCLAICESLYRSILSGAPLDLAVTAARQAVDRAQPGTGDWCKLIFYLQVPTGKFLTSALATAVASVKRPASLRANREVAKLTRLIEVYEANLAAIERTAVSAPASDDLRAQADVLQQRLAAARQQLVEAEGR